jgi:hypothetical protein
MKRLGKTHRSVIITLIDIIAFAKKPIVQDAGKHANRNVDINDVDAKYS